MYASVFHANAIYKGEKMNPGWIFLAIGQVMFWGSMKMSTKRNQDYRFWYSMGDSGFWITVLGIIFFIWG